ncbi:MAG: Holliday junction resolvase RuvX [Coriobacteriales bacterium]|nr:Holliday junction resolvase RuvX [Coriobacteriales bacterium]
MRYLALDIGEKRVGLAVSDASGRMASPLRVLSHAEVFSLAPPFRQLLEDYQPEMLVVGLPLSMDGRENSQAALVREQAEKIATAAGLPLRFVDERLSSAEARRVLRAGGLDARGMRGKTDKIAASLFLQAYLDGGCAVDRKTDEPI